MGRAQASTSCGAGGDTQPDESRPFDKQGPYGSARPLADHCAICHGNDGSGQTELGKNSYPKAPDMREAATRSLSDGELFYAIRNGVRLTALPAWGSGTAEDDQDSWKVVHFVRHLPKITKDEVREMEKMNPKSQADKSEEDEEEQFPSRRRHALSKENTIARKDNENEIHSHRNICTSHASFDPDRLRTRGPRALVDHGQRDQTR